MVDVDDETRRFVTRFVSFGFLTFFALKSAVCLWVLQGLEKKGERFDVFVVW